jgi:Glucosidase II beta subunit-like protein
MLCLLQQANVGARLHIPRLTPSPLLPARVQAVFEGGDYCHQAPARSLRVKLECGAEEHAWDASEPETCAYIVHAATPAACKAESLKVGGWVATAVAAAAAAAASLLPLLHDSPLHLTLLTELALTLSMLLQELESAMAALQAEEAALAAEIAAEEKQRQLDLQQLRARMAATTGGADGTARHDEL